MKMYNNLYNSLSRLVLFRAYSQKIVNAPTYLSILNNPGTRPSFQASSKLYCQKTHTVFQNINDDLSHAISSNRKTISIVPIKALWTTQLRPHSRFYDLPNVPILSFNWCYARFQSDSFLNFGHNNQCAIHHRSFRCNHSCNIKVR